MSKKITQILQKEALPAAYSRLLGRLLVMRTGALTQSAVLPPGVAMRMFVHPQPIVLQVIICHDNRQHWGPSASPGHRPDSIPDLCLGKVIGAC